ncbi:BRISC and BRCA1-A complex member 1 isoform X3 [Zonotrichia leucophrys gambelii]|uniref:BRISC and BRCA1-A complex member 1 isoform X3 n=1 Tax=Zonotrichia leucophrys gambelii TaxID=257770 RepID=UPI0031400574
MVAAGHPKGLQLPSALPRRHFRRSPSCGERGPRHREPPGLGSQPHSNPKTADFGVLAPAHSPVLGCQPPSFGMDTSEPGSAAEDEEEKVPDVRPRTRSNPEGAEDRAPSGPGSVGSRGEAPGNRGEAPGNRSEGEGEAASAGHSPPGQPGTAWHGPASHGQHGEVTVRTPRVNCPEKVIICLDLAEEMAVPKLESFNGCRSNALTVAQKMIEMFVRTKHKIDKSHEFALVVVNNDATWLSGFTSDPREVCSCLYDLDTVVCQSFNLDGLFNLISCCSAPISSSTLFTSTMGWMKRKTRAAGRTCSGFSAAWTPKAPTTSTRWPWRGRRWSCTTAWPSCWRIPCSGRARATRTTGCWMGGTAPRGRPPAERGDRPPLRGQATL